VTTRSQSVVRQPPKCPQRIAQGQQDRPCFAFSFEEDEEQTEEGRRRDSLYAAPSHCF
jgi:hypothetical protein